MQLTIYKTILGAFLISYPMIGVAYVGPGLGAGALAAIVAVVGSIFLALFAVFWYPLKRILKRRKQKRAADEPPAEDSVERKETETRSGAEPTE